MNTIIQTHIDYLSPSRTIEMLKIISDEEEYECFVYNHEGNHFRFFETLPSLFLFLAFQVEPRDSFLEESDLDDFLQKIQLHNN